MTQDDFLMANGWRKFSHDYDKCLFTKNGFETTSITAAITKEKAFSGLEYRESDNYIAETIEPAVVHKFGTDLPCVSCGNEKFTSFSIGTLDGVSRVVQCNNCATVKRTVWRDADGNALSYSEDMTGKYSYATDSVWRSKKELSEHCKRYDLVQKGNDVNTKDKRLKRS